MKKEKSVAKKKESRVGNYAKESFGELKKVTWPKKEEVVSSTVIVIIVIIVFSLILGVVFDVGISKLVEKVLS